MQKLIVRFAGIVSKDPAVDNVIAFTGGQGGTSNAGRMFVSLKPLKDRKLSADLVIGACASKLGGIPGASLFLQAVQDLRIGGRPTPSQYQYSIQSRESERVE